jgi:hypothetical protein
MTFWGIPADGHDNERFSIGSPGDPAGCPGLADASCIATPLDSTEPPLPLVSYPTLCTGDTLVTRLSIQTYQDPDNLTESTSGYPPVDGCEKVVFNPVLFAQPTTTEADSASGLDLVLRSPQFLGFSASPSQLRKSIVTLPEGLTINPDAADGQRSCSDAEANFGTEAAAQCPDTSKIGTFEIGSPTLNGPLTGSLYIGEPKPGSQYRLFMVANGFGINAKLVSTIHPDPQTGQLEIHTQDLPQVPFDEFRLRLFASDRGLLATPTHCHLYDVAAQFFPWNDELADQTTVQTFSIDKGPGGASCPGEKRPFNPRLVAGTSIATAGAFSSFHLKLDRDDGDQFLKDLNFSMPPGLTGDLSGITYCSEPSILSAAANQGIGEQAEPSCPVSSQVGTTNVAAGPGEHPFHAVGKMYLAGPFKGAPLSLVAVTPALAGPYDYGVVVVRVAVHVDPLDAHVFAASDTVPSIIGGIPIRMRSIQVNIDRPDFIVNPTNCSSMSVDSQGVGDQGAVTDFSSYFNAVDCSTLPFKPKMTVRQFGGSKKTRRAANPQMQFDLRTRKGDANIKSLTVTLPTAFEIDQRHLGNICSEKELTAKDCEGRTPIGRATTETPLLDQPLSGLVYAVSGSGGLPKLAFILDGQVSLVPRAETRTVIKNDAARLRTTVPVVPDAPIGHFSLTVFGGKAGYLVNTRSLCGHPPVAKVSYTAQSGKTRSQSVRIGASCGKKRSQTKRLPG